VILNEGKIIGVVDDSIYKNEGEVINSIPDEVYEHTDIEIEEHIITTTLGN